MECKICKKIIADDGSSVTLRQLGANGVNEVSKWKGDDIHVEEGDVVHVDCRKTYIKKRKVDRTSEQDSSCSTRSKNTFDFHSNCFLCGNVITKRERETSGVCNVTCKNREVDEAIKKQILIRGDDTWAIAVNGRLQYVNDLRAEDAVYHVICNSNFRIGQSIPKKYASTSPAQSKKRGRPSDPGREAAYSKAVQFLLEKAKEDELVTLNDMKKEMDKALGGVGGSFSTKWIHSRLLVDFTDEIVVANVNGREHVVTFITTANKILSDFQASSKLDDVEGEKIRIIKAAAKIIKSEIKAKECDLSSYPSFDLDKLSTNYLTPFLNTFLKELITASGNEVKRAALGQAIMQNTRPNSLICPLQIGLAVQLHSQFGSRIMIEVLSKLGFCSSYTEALKFVSSAAYHQNITLPPLCDTSVLHYVADNVDHNIRTIDGHNTFHGMGIIAIVTPGRSSPIVVPRCTVSSEDIISVGRIEFKILFLTASKDLTFKFEALKPSTVIDNAKLLGTLWQSAWILKPSQPQWNGYMQSVLDGSYPGKSTVHIMPMIDAKSSDYSCIYTTMYFIATEAKKYNRHPLLTFDQPLYWKAIEIQKHAKESIVNDIVLILGSFHILMSYLGSIGHLMTGSGLQPLLEQVYAENTVPHILSGKAVSRARRAHMLATCSLEGMKISQMYGIDLDFSSSKNDDQVTDISECFMQHPELRELADVLQKSVTKTVRVEQLTEMEIFNELLTKKENFLRNNKDFKTSQLWFMYMDMVDIMCTFIKAERTGNFLLHHKSINTMLPYFAASGHYHYTKSAYCYLQQMQNLPSQNPEVYNCFVKGYNVVRRSETFWAGIGTDLMIEQELMRSVKTTGGLTHGRGMTELQRTKWLLSTTTTAAVKQAMENFTDIRYESSEQHVVQHKELSITRSSRDYQDAIKMLLYLELRNPFEGYCGIVNIETGEEGDENVNVHMSKVIGTKIINTMIGQPVLTYSFSKKDMAVTMKPRCSLVIDGDVVSVDPQLMFQRLLVTVGRDDVQLKNALQYELCSHPASIIGKDGLMREADKPVLADDIWKKVEHHVELPSDPIYILDGGNLLFKVKWKKGTIFETIFEAYVQYVLKHYGQKSVIVFDGYPEIPTTKDTTHLRRRSSKTGRFVNVTPHMKLNMSKESFLSVLKNKNLFNLMLTDYINSGNSGLCAIQADGDADYLLAKTAITYSEQSNVVVVSADTDVLVLLIHHVDISNESFKKVFLTSEATKLKKCPPKIWDIFEAKKILGVDLSENIFQIHALLGCDTTSRIHGIGKGVALKKYESDIQFRKNLSIFSNSSATQDEVAEAGENLISKLYGEKYNFNLNDVRYAVFCKKISTRKTVVSPESLPPTSDAAKLHSFRVFHQVQIWKGISLDAEKWGWIRKGNLLLPKLMTQAPAPPDLLKIIRCNCKTNCSSNRCYCQKNKLKCTPMCGFCKGRSCLNQQDLDNSDYDETLI